jgi:ABC-type branched-subunit amino acid transport system ATPase component
MLGWHVLCCRIDKKGIAVLLVEQDAVIALRLPNQGHVIGIGRIVLSGERAELAN